MQNYGFQRMPDGSLEVSHHGESFDGPIIVKWIVSLHAQYVIWATEKHINSPLFGTENLEAQEEQRSNIPLHVAQLWLKDLQEQQGAATQKRKLHSQPTMQQEQTQKALKRLARADTVIEVRRLPGGSLKFQAEDPETQATIKAALKDIKTANGSDAAGDALNKLLKTMPSNKNA